MTQITIQKQNFLKVRNLLSLIKDVCSDADIRGGILRQVSNNKTFLIECDLTSIIGENDLVLTLIKNKLQLLSIFDDGVNTDDIKFVEFENKYIFSDNQSQLRFTVSRDSAHLDNRFLTVDNKNDLFTYSPQNLIFSYTMTLFTLNKIKIITENLSVDDIAINISNGSASFDIVSFNKLNDATLDKGIFTSNLPADKNYKITLSSIPFKLAFDNNIIFNLYKNTKDTENKKVICECKTSCSGFDTTLYIPGFLIDLNSEEQ